MRSHTHTFKSADGGCTTEALEAIMWKVTELAHTSPNSVMTLKNSVPMRAGVSLHNLGKTIPVNTIRICQFLPIPKMGTQHGVTSTRLHGSLDLAAWVSSHSPHSLSLAYTGSLGPRRQRADSPGSTHSTLPHTLHRESQVTTT